MFIFSNLATSLDGKIASADRRNFPLGTPADRLQMQVLRKRANAILMGAATLRAFKGPLRVRGAKQSPVNVVLSSTLAGVSTRWPFFRAPDIQRLIFTGPKTPLARIAKMRKFAEVIRLDGRRPVAPQIVAALEARGLKRLLVEGGGGVMWDFVERDLLDELHVTLTPWIIGGKEAPTLVDGRGFSSGRGRKLRLVRVRRLHDELYLTYRKA